MPGTQKSINSNNPGSGHGKLVQLVFVNHMSKLPKFYCSVSFACEYIQPVDETLRTIRIMYFNGVKN